MFEKWIWIILVRSNSPCRIVRPDPVAQIALVQPDQWFRSVENKVIDVSLVIHTRPFAAAGRSAEGIGAFQFCSAAAGKGSEALCIRTAEKFHAICVDETW